MLFDDLERGGWSKTEGIYVYIQLIHFIIQQKLTQHGKATISHYHPSCAQLRWLFRPLWTIELATPWTIQLKTLGTTDCQAPLSMGFPRQEYCCGLSFPPPGIFPTQGSNLLHLNLKKQTNKKKGLFSCLQSPAPSALPASLTGTSTLTPSPIFSPCPSLTSLLSAPQTFQGHSHLVHFLLSPPSVLNAIFKFLTNCLLPMIHISAKSSCL